MVELTFFCCRTFVSANDVPALEKGVVSSSTVMMRQFYRP